MYEAILVEQPNDAVCGNIKKKKSEEDNNINNTNNTKSPTVTDLKPAVPSLPVGGRSRSQSTTRRVTPTTIATPTLEISAPATSSTNGTGTVGTVTGAVTEKALPNGDLYIGSFFGNAPNGSGKYLWKDGCMYEGEWRRGKASGKGKFSWPSGATYEGEFKSGRMEGFGTFTGSDGDTYRGSWSSDRKHGYGEKRYANGDFYEGCWKKNLQDGQGRYVWKNGNEYIGEWKNGVISGRGTLIWANGNKYEGQWENGAPKSSGVFTWPDGSCYIGTWNISSKDVKLQQLNGTYYHGSNGKEQNLVVTSRKRSSVDGARASLNEKNIIFPRICIWESDGEAGDITCDIIDNVEASMIYDRFGFGIDQDGIRQFRRSPCCFNGEVKKPGQTISKGHKNYELMLNLQLGIR